MISEMLTRVPGPQSLKISADQIIWSTRMEKTNVWDIDGNRFLDLTSAGGLLPFGYIDEGLLALQNIEGDFLDYKPEIFSRQFSTWLESQSVLYAGASIETAFSASNEKQEFITLESLMYHDGSGLDLLIVQAEYLDSVRLKNIASWCKKFNITWVADEREVGMFRTGVPFASACLDPAYLPDIILSTIATEEMKASELIWSRVDKLWVENESVDFDLLKVAKNYADKDLSRTNNLQSMELNGLLKDSILGKEIISAGAMHLIELGHEKEVKRVVRGLLQRGIIAASMGSKLVLLPSLYLALGEILFTVNHLRLVIENKNEIDSTWMNDSLRDLH